MCQKWRKVPNTIAQDDTSKTLLEELQSQMQVTSEDALQCSHCLWLPTASCDEASTEETCPNIEVRANRLLQRAWWVCVTSVCADDRVSGHLPLAAL